MTFPTDEDLERLKTYAIVGVIVCVLTLGCIVGFLIHFGTVPR